MAKLKPMLHKWGAATLYHLRQPITLDEVDQVPAWKLPSKTQSGSIGLLPIHDKTKAVRLTAKEGGWFRIRISTKKPNTSEFNRQVLARIATLKGKKSGQSVDYAKLLKKEFASIQDEVRADMMPTTQPGHNDVDVMFLGDWFVITNASNAVCDRITKYLKEKLNNFVVTVAKASGEDPLSSVGQSLMESNALKLDNIELDNSIKVGTGKSSIACNNTDFLADDALLQVLRSQDKVHSMGICWGSDKKANAADVTCKVRSDFTLSSIKLNENKAYNTDTEGDNTDDLSYLVNMQRALFFMKNIPLVINDIAIHDHGLAPLPEMPQQQVADLDSARKKKAAKKK